MADSSRASRKSAIRDALTAHDREAVSTWARQERSPLRVLVTVLFDPEPLIQWRTIEAIGISAPILALRDMEKVRRQIRQLLWLMNDESGGICWMAPEAIGEIVHAIPELAEEYLPLMPSFFREEPFEFGSRWAVARTGQEHKSLYTDATPALRSSLIDHPTEIRAASALALQSLDELTEEDLSALDNSNGDAVPLYDTSRGEMVNFSLPELATRLRRGPFFNADS